MLTQDERARVLAALPRAQLIASRYRRDWPGDPAELSSIAFEVLAAAVKSHDPARAPLAAYALKRIRGEILRRARREGRHRYARLLAAESIEIPPGEPSIEEALDDTAEAARRRAVEWARGEVVRLALRALSAEPGPDSEETLMTREARRCANDALKRALARLPVRQARVLKLRVRDGLPVADVAARLGCDPSTVRRLAAQAKARLARELAREGIHAPPPSAPPSSKGETFDALRTLDPDT